MIENYNDPDVAARLASERLQAILDRNRWSETTNNNVEPSSSHNSGDDGREARNAFIAQGFGSFRDLPVIGSRGRDGNIYTDKERADDLEAQINMFRSQCTEYIALVEKAEEEQADMSKTIALLRQRLLATDNRNMNALALLKSSMESQVKAWRLMALEKGFTSWCCYITYMKQHRSHMRELEHSHREIAGLQGELQAANKMFRETYSNLQIELDMKDRIEDKYGKMINEVDTLKFALAGGVDNENIKLKNSNEYLKVQNEELLQEIEKLRKLNNRLGNSSTSGRGESSVLTNMSDSSNKELRRMLQQVESMYSETARETKSQSPDRHHPPFSPSSSLSQRSRISDANLGNLESSANILERNQQEIKDHLRRLNRELAELQRDFANVVRRVEEFLSREHEAADMRRGTRSILAGLQSTLDGLVKRAPQNQWIAAPTSSERRPVLGSLAITDPQADNLIRQHRRDTLFRALGQWMHRGLIHSFWQWRYNTSCRRLSDVNNKLRQEMGRLDARHQDLSRLHAKMDALKKMTKTIESSVDDIDATLDSSFL